ncbi:MAG: hypothetical protein RR035_08880, partial [Oscillibacter sp.]
HVVPGTGIIGRFFQNFEKWEPLIFCGENARYIDKTNAALPTDWVSRAALIFVFWKALTQARRRGRSYGVWGVYEYSMKTFRFSFAVQRMAAGVPANRLSMLGNL